MEAHLISLIQSKLDFLKTLATIGMTWWLSSVVFCGSIIGSVWIKRHDLSNAPRLFAWLGVGLTCFFSGIAGFGAFTMWTVRRLETETLQLLALVQPWKSGTPFPGAVEFDGVFMGMALATLTFVFVTVAWVFLCLWIRQSNKTASAAVSGGAP
jgi:hypothetical protein